MGVQVIPIRTEVVSHSLPFPFPILCFIPIPNSVFYSHSHGIRMGFPVPLGIPFPYTSLLCNGDTSSQWAALVEAWSHTQNRNHGIHCRKNWYIWWGTGSNPHAKFDDNPFTWDFWANWWNIGKRFVTFHYFCVYLFLRQAQRLDYRRFWRNGSKDAESWKGVPFGIKIQFLNVTPISPKMPNFDPKQVV